MESLRIVDYQEKHQPYFQSLNEAWLKKYFKIEPIDEKVLGHPFEEIIEPGGAIVMGEENGEIVGTVAIKLVEPKVYEMTKMAVDEKHQGKGYGEAIAKAVIEKAKSLGAKKVILYSQTGLVPAIKLYRKIGFIEIPITDQKYERCDIKMELVF